MPERPTQGFALGYNLSVLRTENGLFVRRPVMIETKNNDDVGRLLRGFDEETS